MSDHFLLHLIGRHRLLFHSLVNSIDGFFGKFVSTTRQLTDTIVSLTKSTGLFQLLLIGRVSGLVSDNLDSSVAFRNVFGVNHNRVCVRVVERNSLGAVRIFLRHLLTVEESYTLVTDSLTNRISPRGVIGLDFGTNLVLGTTRKRSSLSTVRLFILNLLTKINEVKSNRFLGRYRLGCFSLLRELVSSERLSERTHRINRILAASYNTLILLRTLQFQLLLSEAQILLDGLTVGRTRLFGYRPGNLTFILLYSSYFGIDVLGLSNVQRRTTQPGVLERLLHLDSTRKLRTILHRRKSILGRFGTEFARSFPFHWNRKVYHVESLRLFSWPVLGKVHHLLLAGPRLFHLDLLGRFGLGCPALVLAEDELLLQIGHTLFVGLSTVLEQITLTVLIGKQIELLTCRECFINKLGSGINGRITRLDRRWLGGLIGFSLSTFLMDFSRNGQEVNRTGTSYTSKERTTGTFGIVLNVGQLSEPLVVSNSTSSGIKSGIGRFRTNFGNTLTYRASSKARNESLAPLEQLGTGKSLKCVLGSYTRYGTDQRLRGSQSGLLAFVVVRSKLLGSRNYSRCCNSWATQRDSRERQKRRC